MTHVTITYQQIDGGCFKFHFQGENFCTSMYMNNPFSVPKVEWQDLRDDIEKEKFHTLELKNGHERFCIEVDSDFGFVTFIRNPLGDKNISLQITVNNKTKAEKDELLKVFDQLLDDEKNASLWK